MKNKQVKIIVSVILLLTIVVFTYNNFTNKNEEIVLNKKTETKTGTTSLSMMLETEHGSGNYEESSESSWPSDGYTFNETLSKCEQGGILTWNEDEHKVYLSTTKSDKCYVYFDKLPDITLLTDYIKGLYTTDGENGLYLHDATLANSANDGSYRYAGGDYELTSTATAAGYTRLVTAANTETDGLINFYCNGEKQYVGYSCSTSYTYYYTVAAGTTQYTTYQEALDAGVSQGYLTKDNVKNFVCFGTDAATCPVANLYRIIGVIDGQVKIIKYDYATSDLLGTDGDYYGSPTYHYSGRRDLTAAYYRYYWNKANYDAAYSATSYYNVWSYSQLNTVNLNTNYISNIGTKWANMIATTTWKVGGNSWSNIGTQAAATAYQNEIVNPNTDVETTYEAKIGLMYVSDYMYAADPSNWTYLGCGTVTTDYRAIKGSNWMYMGDYDWTISRSSDLADYAFNVGYYGYVFYNYVGNGFGVRPSFNLESSVEITGGSGTASDPYRLS